MRPPAEAELYVATDDIEIRAADRRLYVRCQNVHITILAASPEAVRKALFSALETHAQKRQESLE